MKTGTEAVYPIPINPNMNAFIGIRKVSKQHRLKKAESFTYIYI